MRCWAPRQRLPGDTLARVVVDTTAGGRHTADLTAAPGDPDDPDWTAIVGEKFDRYARDVPPPLDALVAHGYRPERPAS